MKFLRMTEVDLAAKRVMLREDLNVPVSNGRITSDARIRAALPSIEYALGKGAAVIVLSHLGRPVEGEYSAEFSLAPVAVHLAELLGQPVRLQKEWLDGVAVAPGEVVLCENVRFSRGEKSNDEALAARMAALCDVFVMDAFGTAHRAQASTEGVIRKAPVACAGMLLSAELDALRQALHQPARPLLAIVGGAKVSTKLTVLQSLLEKVDGLIIGGGIANTFIAASGYDVGKSLYEPGLVAEAQRLIRQARAAGGAIPIPRDVVVATSMDPQAEAFIRLVDGVKADEMILDIGPRTLVEYAHIISGAGTILWNGPVGVFELESFAAGTRGVAEAIGRSQAFSIAGGGDTLAAIDQFCEAGEISYISTGGGAFLEFVEGKTLPAVAALEERFAADA